MLLTKRKTAVAVLLVLGLVAFGGGLLTRRAPAEQPADDKVRSLLKERLATLKEMAAESEKVFEQTGRSSPEDVLQAKTLVLLAELDLCDSDRERVGIHEKIVALAKGMEEITDTRFKAGRAQHTDLLKARADRLNAEIALERARAKAATQPK